MYIIYVFTRPAWRALALERADTSQLTRPSISAWRAAARVVGGSKAPGVHVAQMTLADKVHFVVTNELLANTAIPAGIWEARVGELAC